MYYKLTEEITDFYSNYNDDSYYTEHLETEFRYKLLLLVKISQLVFTKEEFEKFVDNFSQDPNNIIFRNVNDANLIENIIDRFEYQDRYDGGCIIKLYIKHQFEELVYNALDNSIVNEFDIIKYELKGNIKY